MNNVKTGLFIKDLRKEKNMTQKQLADLLYITDRAVSKWERGLCAPDIALLEPLTVALEISLLELIKGARKPRSEYSERIEIIDQSTRAVIDYSKNEIDCKAKHVKKKITSMVTACMVLVLLAAGLFLWKGGYFYIIDKIASPNDKIHVTVYNKNFSENAFGRFTMDDATSVVVQYKDSKDRSTRVAYGDCVYQGVWWAPDSNKYVISLKYGDEVHLALAWIEKGSESNLSAYLSMGVELSELSNNGYLSNESFPKIEYEFLQWALDSESMLIRYCFADQANKIHEGYFWYHCELGTLSAVLRLDS